MNRARALLRAAADKPGAWLALAVVTTLLAALIPLAFVRRYYFRGDTQIGAFGQWYHLGEKLRAGEWPLIDLAAWHGGNYVSEGQWGLFSPLTMGIGLLATTVTHVVVFVTVLKFTLLAVAAVGVFLLARSYGLPPAAAYLTAVAAPLGGATQYFDNPEWVTGQMVWTLAPWAWWALRRMIRRHANPALALVVGLLIVTVGYVYGTIYLVVIFLACLADAWIARERAAALRIFLVGVCCGLVAVTVYLPGVLTASVTTRAGAAVLSDGRLQADLPGLAASMIPTVMSPSTPTYGSGAPAHYIAWFLPVLAWLDAAKVRRVLRPLAGLLGLVVLGLLWALGPNQVGPLRWPVRVLPFLTLTVVLLTVILLTMARRRQPSPARFLVSLVFPVFASYLIASRFWEESWSVPRSLAYVVVGLLLAWVALRRLGPRRTAVVMAVWSVLGVALQHTVFPWPTAVDRHMPSTIAGYRTQVPAASGEVIVVGNPEPDVLAGTGAVRDFLIASSWYVNPHPVQNVYSTIGFTAFNDRYGLRFDGATYPYLVNTLFSVEPTTKRARVDLLSIGTLYFVRSEQTAPLTPPAGWRVAAETDWSVTWVRQTPVPPAGGVVWSGGGAGTAPSPAADTALTVLAESTREVRLRVDSPGPARVVLSRLAWPGYHASGARLVAPTDGYLVTAEIPAGTPGRLVTIRYDPPGWPLELATLWSGLGLGVLWSAGFAVVHRRRPRHLPSMLTAGDVDRIGGRQGIRGPSRSASLRSG